MFNLNNEKKERDEQEEAILDSILMHWIKNSQFASKCFVKMLQLKFQFTKNALRLIAIAQNTGARGLRSILESILTEAVFEVSGSKPGKESIEVVLVDEETVGTADTVGCGANVLRDSSELENISPPTGSTMTMEKKEARKEDLDSESEAPARALNS